MRVWFEVTKDLLLFATGRDYEDSPQMFMAASRPAELPPTPTYEFDAVAAAVPAALQPNPNTELVSLEQVEIAPIVRPRHSALTEPERMFITVPHTKCFLRPVRAFDTVIASFAYGDRVLVSRLEGRFAAVSKDGISGWVLKDAVTVEENDVFPQLETGVVYDAHHLETQKLRALIHDEFSTHELLLPLEGVEYVWYRLMQAGRTPHWSQERPRIAGRWQQLLRGCQGVHIGVQPVTHSVLEYVTESGEGAVYFVEAVKPDETIEVSGIDSRVAGRFTRETFSKQQWQEWRPVFIAIT